MTAPSVMERLATRTTRSAELAQSSRKVLPKTNAETLTLARPVFAKRAKGSRVTDVDGNEYVDLIMGFGPHILGHAPDVVVEAVREVAADGVQLALPSERIERLARAIVGAAPCAENVLFCSTGTEATMHAIRGLRAFTGRSKIAIFEGGYHGAHDYVLTTVDPESPTDAPTFRPRKSGIPAATQSTVIMLPYWHDAALEMIWRNRHDLALVMIEPVQGGNPQSGHVDWLRNVREVCREADVPFVFDEVITGFRMGLGGAQETFGIVPDIATYGKVLGGGLPIGAVAGRADIMEAFAKHALGSYPADREAFATGTFNNNPMSMAAGYAVVDHLRKHPELYEHLRQQSDRLALEINGFCEAEGIPARINHNESIFLLYFGYGPARTTRELAAAQADAGPSGEPLSKASDVFFAHLLDAGVLGLGMHHFHLSTAHTADDVDTVIGAMKSAFLATREAGLC